MVFKTDDFTEQAQEVLANSQNLVHQYKHSQWDVEHIFMGLLELEDGLPLKILYELNIKVEDLKKKLGQYLDKNPKVVENVSQIYASPRAVTLLERAKETLLKIEGLTPIGTAKDKVSVFSFILDGVHPHDAGTVLDESGIALRVGHHCTQPLMKRFSVPATIRASFSIYNTLEEIDILAKGIKEVQEILT